MSRSRHGGKGTRAYRIWQAMLNRCRNANVVCYPHYGGRGIKVCERWHSFPAFLADMGEPPEGTTIERVDNDGDYAPGNCRWATRKEQMNNTRACKLVTYNGKTQTVAAWAEELGINRYTLYNRLNDYGWSIEQSLTVVARPRGRHSRREQRENQ
jgi:hypothetical protein